MSDTRGVFRLLDVVENKLEDTWIPLSDVWTAPSPSGSPVRFSDGAAESPNTGYFGGGFPGVYSTMDKVTYSTDTTAQVPGAALSAARQALVATGNLTNGYFGGGYNPNYSTMDKVTYSNDTTAAVPGAALSSTRGIAAASSGMANGLLQPPAATPTPGPANV